MSKAIAYLIYFIFRSLNATYRFEHLQLEKFEQAKSLTKNKTYFFGSWHQHVFSCFCACLGRSHLSMTSRSKDGEMVAFLLSKMNFIPVRGSSSRGGKEVMNETIKQLKKDDNIYPAAITIDGPRGPAKVPKMGIIEIARQAQQPIIPYSAIPKKYWQFNSWDKFRLPMPFTKIFVIYGDPIMVDPDLNKDDYQEVSEKITNELEKLEKIAVATINSK